MATNGIGNLSTLIKRLEAATSRLEDIAVHGSSSSAAGSGGFIPAAAAPAPPAAPAAAATAATAPSSAPPVEDPPAVTAWDESVGEALKDYETLSAKLGGVVNEQAAAVVATFVNVRSVILTAAACTKPSGGASSPLFAELLKPLQTSLVTVGELRDKNRGDKTFFNHLSTVSEGIPAVGWVAVDPKPGPFVAEMRDSAQFYANRVIKDHKDTDKVHVEWCRAYIKTLETMREYVMKTHTTGLVWNPKGGDLASYRPGPPATAGPPVGAPPPPPPPPGPPAPPPPPPPAAAAGDAGAGGMDAVFSQLNKGEGITAGLKKVDASQMTHKNPALREAGAPVSAAAKSKAAPPRPGAKPAALRPKKPPKTALEGNKWTVEFHEDDGNIVIGETELSQTVHIFGCKNSVITIKGKVNAVALVSCVKTSVLLDTLVSSLEITSSPSFTVQVTGRTPTILIDSCDSGQVYLSRTGLDAEIVTAKCSAINISVPGEGEEDEYRERALPEQLRHRIVDGKVVTDVVAHSG